MGISIDHIGLKKVEELTYEIPAYSEGEVDAELELSVIDSENISEINDMVTTMLSNNQLDQINKYDTSGCAANLSFWNYLTKGKNTSSNKMKELMEDIGLKDQQVDNISDKMYDMVNNRVSVKIHFHIDNTNNPKSVQGSIKAYIVTGHVSTDKGNKSFTMLSQLGILDNNNKPVKGKITYTSLDS